MEFYLANLLANFAHTENLYGLSQVCHADECLSIILKKAMHMPPGQKISMLRRMGDIALYFSGIFPERFRRKIIDVDYYIEMGQIAYTSVADLLSTKTDGDGFNEIFIDLSEKFSSLVDILSEVSDHDKKSNLDVLRLYERWLKTGSQYAKNKLLGENINVLDRDQISHLKT